MPRKVNRTEIGELQIRFAGGFARLSEGRRGVQRDNN